MDKKSLTFFWLFGLLLMTSVSVMFYRYIIQEDFVVFLPEEVVEEEFEQIPEISDLPATESE